MHLYAFCCNALSGCADDNPTRQRERSEKADAALLWADWLARRE